MLVHADKFYGVLFNNQKLSSIRSIKREEAMEFVEQVKVPYLCDYYISTDFLTIGGSSAIMNN